MLDGVETSEPSAIDYRAPESSETLAHFVVGSPEEKPGFRALMEIIGDGSPENPANTAHAFGLRDFFRRFDELFQESPAKVSSMTDEKILASIKIGNHSDETISQAIKLLENPLPQEAELIKILVTEAASARAENPEGEFSINLLRGKFDPERLARIADLLGIKDYLPQLGDERTAVFQYFQGLFEQLDALDSFRIAESSFVNHFRGTEVRLLNEVKNQGSTTQCYSYAAYHVIEAARNSLAAKGEDAGNIRSVNIETLSGRLSSATTTGMPDIGGASSAQEGQNSPYFDYLKSRVRPDGGYRIQMIHTPTDFDWMEVLQTLRTGDGAVIVRRGLHARAIVGMRENNNRIEFLIADSLAASQEPLWELGTQVVAEVDSRKAGEPGDWGNVLVKWTKKNES